MAQRGLNLTNKLNDRSETSQGKDRYVDIRKLQAAAEKLPLNWPVRNILLLESQEIEVSVFLARLPVYLHLLNLGGRPS